MPVVPPLSISSVDQTGQIQLNTKWSGTLLVINDTIYTLELDFDDGRIRYVPANTPRAFNLCRNKFADYKVAYSLSVNATAANVVTFELHEESPSATQDLQGVGPLSRVFVLGNQGSIQTTGSNTLSNTGNPAGSSVITMADSAIPSGWNVEIDNDGTMFINVLDTGTYTTVFSVTPGTATSAALITLLRLKQLDSDNGAFTSDGSGNATATALTTSGKGTFGSLSSDAAKITSDGAGHLTAVSFNGLATSAESLNNQVTSTDTGTAQLYSTVDARGIALGYKDSGGTYHQVITCNTDGTSAVAGTFSVGGILYTPGGGALEWYPTTNAQQYWTPQSGAAAWHEFVTWNGSASKVLFGIGSAAAGYSTVYIRDDGVPVYQYGTAAAMNSAGGGASGLTVWEGTTDPGASANEGDVWLDG